MCLCTCVKAFVTTLPKFSRQNSDKFLLNFWKWGKNNKPCKNFLCKNLRLNMYHDFLTSLRNHACKSTKDLFLSKSQKDSKAILFDESNSLLQFIPWKKWKKIFIWTRRIQLWPLCQKNSRQTSGNLLLKFRNWWKVCALSQQSCFSPKRSSNMHNEILASLA